MKNLFDNIFGQAEDTHNKNKEIEARKKEILTVNLKEMKKEISNPIKDYENNCHSKELLGLIKKHQFEIKAYEQTEGDKNDSVLEIYYCKKNNWKFQIKNHYDEFIEEGIFLIEKVTHPELSEPLNFYCDLGCRNTGEAKLKEFLKMLEYESQSDYIKTAYKRYLNLPSMLRAAGYEVEEVEYDFSINEPRGYLKLGDNLFVKIYRAWMDDIKLVVTSHKNWDINSYNSHVWNKEKAYYFPYASEESFAELCKCIECFKEDESGKIGFLEKDGSFYGNSDIYRLFEEYKHSDSVAYNTYKIQVKHEEHWDSRGYDEENSKIVNKYKGLEIFTETRIVFNDAAQWTIGEYANTSFITFEYDKRKDLKNCKLVIKNYIHGDDFETSVINEESDEYDIVRDESKLVEHVECTGTFFELFDILKYYIRKMCEIHEIDVTNIKPR